jgi:hypothetical protein
LQNGHRIIFIAWNGHVHSLTGTETPVSVLDVFSTKLCILFSCIWKKFKNVTSLCKIEQKFPFLFFVHAKEPQIPLGL